MYKRTYSKLFKDVTKKDVWHTWTDVNNWPTWHDDLEYCKMEGEFKVGSYFMLKPKGAHAVKIVLTEINVEHSFTDCTVFFGAKMFDTHMIQETPEGLLLTNTLIVTGPLQWLWVWLVAKHVADSVPQETESLIKRIKERYV